MPRKKTLDQNKESIEQTQTNTTTKTNKTTKTTKTIKTTKTNRTKVQSEHVEVPTENLNEDNPMTEPLTKVSLDDKETDDKETDDKETDDKETDDMVDVVVLAYDNYIPKHPFRESIYKKFYNLLIENKGDYNYTDDDLQKIALNIERGIFNSSLKGVISWDNMVKTRYTSVAVRIFSNLNPKSYLKNVNLIHRLFTKEFTEFELIKLDPEHIFPERYYEIMQDYIASQPKIAAKQEQPDGIHKCGYCASQKQEAYKTTYYQLQTRSAKIIGWKSILLITSWLCYWENSCSPSKILRC